ncbi:Sterol 3-beta-glucosyltransferase [Tulasnella sp. 418]|nr:Sterol 3-beta-glucosyltransferase [Tulasnella sp. 418]
MHAETLWSLDVLFSDFLASSIHTIHRPVARSRRGTPATAYPSGRKPDKSVVPGGRSRDPGYFTSPSDGETAEEELVDISEEDSEPDFEPAPPPQSASGQEMGNALGMTKQGRTREATVSTIRPESTDSKRKPDYASGAPMSAIPARMNPPRQGSMATVRLKRRARLAEKLRDVFGLKEIEEVVAEMPCWLMRSVLLQGYMYLTNAHLCFFAHMPSREDQVLKSGSLSRKTQRTKRWTKHWYVLKNDVLSWYQSSSDPYFPHGNVDLRYAISCEPFGEKDFKLRTNQKTLQLSADSVPSRDEWVKAIRKVIFKAQNHGESVKISIPFSVIEDVVHSAALDFTDTLEVRIVDKSEHYVDSYFFAYFHDLHDALVQIREVVQAYQRNPPSNSSTTVKDTTSKPNVAAPHHVHPQPVAPAVTSRFALTSFFKPLTESLPLSRTASAPVSPNAQSPHSAVIVEPQAVEEFTHVDLSNSEEGHAESSMNGGALTPSAERQGGILDAALTPKIDRSPLPHTSTNTSASTGLTTMSAPLPDHTYPPSPRLGAGENHSVSSLASWAVPNWLKQSSSKLRFFSSPYGNGQHSDEAASHVREVYETNLSSSGFRSASPEGMRSSVGAADVGNLEYSMLEAPGAEVVDAVTVDKFRSYFAFDEKEQLLGCK